jgi:hypothetical protein
MLQYGETLSALDDIWDKHGAAMSEILCTGVSTFFHQSLFEPLYDATDQL